MSGYWAPGWYPDPMHRHERRYFDGREWTHHVADGQATGVDPLQPAPVAPPPVASPPPPPAAPPSGVVRTPNVPPPTAPPTGPPPGGGFVVPPAGPPPGAAPMGPSGPSGPGRRGLWGALVVAALVLGTGIFVGVQLGKGDAPAKRQTAVDVLGEGTPGPGVSGYLTLGATSEPVSATVGTAGGTVDAGAGVALGVPAGAFAGDTSFNVTRTEIIDDSFGEMVEAGSALITVDNGGVFALEPITISFPVSVADGQFAMAVFYDEANARVEPLPIVSLSDGTLVATTRHFSSIFVTVVDLAMLDTGMIDSGFRPGVDSWQFVNYGSAIASGGHCSGQSLSALWYYEAMKVGAGAPGLYGRYDDRVDGIPYDATDGFQWDDTDGYRFASTIQEDQYAAGVSTYEQAMRKLSYARVDRLQYYAFAYAILLTGMPQYVGIWSSAGGGHAMIVYGVTPDALLISDPNFPSEYREIPWNATTGVLGPYEGQANGATAKHPYETIGYYAKSALVDWSTLSNRWQEFLAGTIGDNYFTDSSLEIRRVDADGNESWSPLVDGFTVDQSEATVTVRRANGGGVNDRTVVYKGTSVVTNGAWDAPVTVPLAEGANPLGFAWWHYVWEAQPDGSAGYETWADFSRLTIIRGETEGPALDLIFVIDLTSSMEDDIAGVKESARQIVQKIAATNENWRVAIVGYRDVGDDPMFEDYPFEDTADAVIANIDALSVSGGGDDPEAVYEALMRAIDSSTVGGWRPNQNKQIILMGDAPPHEPGSGGETAESVARAAELADPVVVQSVVVAVDGVMNPEAQRTFEQMSTLTKGRAFTAQSASEVPGALQQSIGATSGTSFASPGKGTDWGRLAILVAALALMLLGAGLVLRRLWRKAPVVGAPAPKGTGALVAGAVALLVGVGGSLWWGVTNGADAPSAPRPAADAPMEAPATRDTSPAPTVAPPDTSVPDTAPSG